MFALLQGEQFQHFHQTKAISMVALRTLLAEQQPSKQSFTQHIERMALQLKSLMIVPL